MSSSPRPWTSVLETALVLSGVVATAGASLLLEDLLPLAKGQQFSPARFVWTAVAGVVLVWLLIHRQRRTRTTGTLYYLRYLQEWMSDWHLADLDLVKGGYLDRRVIGQWSTAAPAAGVLDLTRDTEAISSELQRSTNDDRSDTGFNIAPNLLLPVAIGVGFDLYAWDTVTLEEWLGPPVLTWQLTDAPGPGSHDIPVCLMRDREQSALAVLVTADLTPQGATTPPRGRFRRHYRVGVFAGPELATSRPVVVTTDPARGLATDSTAFVHPVRATKCVVGAIRRALHENPSCLVVFAARLPKTVALAVGWGLANWTARDHPGCGVKGCRQSGCLHPWKRLVVAMPNQEATGDNYLFTRVHAGQPSASQILTAVGVPR